MVFEPERTGIWQVYGSTASSQPLSTFDYDSFCDLHKLGFLKHFPAAGASRFACYLLLYFPEVAENIEEGEHGVLHLEVGALTLATGRAIQKRDWPTVRMHFAFVDAVLDAAETELYDAIGISYLGNIFYDEISINYAKARTLMPKRLAIALEIIERHYEDLEYERAGYAGGISNMPL